MPTAVFNGIRLYYEVHGQGTPLVLMHGFAGTAESWKPQIPDLSARYRLVLYDARGHWRSESPRSADLYSHEVFAEDLRALLDHLSAETAVVGGLSMGGVIALTFYFAHPQRVRALILADRDYHPAPDIRLKHAPSGLAHVNRKVLVMPDSRLTARPPEVAVPTLV